ncbi:MAG: hypothetical protein GY943_05305 [Chloroflexi bacterium]|nr:hypothetical protein [Chloroflexota bacterium]
MSDESVNEVEETAPEIEIVTPVIVDMGKTKSKHIKRLKKGKGQLMDEVVDVLDEVAGALGDELEGKMMVPIVILYKEKKKNKRTRIKLPF